MIEAIQLGNEAKAQAALEIFCAQYRDVVFRFFRRRLDHHLAEDYTQEFFEKKIHNKWDNKEGLLFTVQRLQNCKFRHYLAAALRGFLIDKGRAKRDPLKGSVSDGLDRVTENDVEQIQLDCDRELALRIVRRVIQSAQPSDYQLNYLNEDISNIEAAAALGMKEGTFRVSINRLSERLRRALREEVRSLVASDAEVDDEIRHFMEIVRLSGNVTH